MKTGTLINTGQSLPQFFIRWIQQGGFSQSFKHFGSGATGSRRILCGRRGGSPKDEQGCAGNCSMAGIMTFKLLSECEKKWRKIRGWQEIKKLLSGVEYRNGLVVNNQKDQMDAAAG